MAIGKKNLLSFLVAILAGLVGVLIIGLLVLIVASEWDLLGESKKMQISKTEYQRKALRVHKMLADVSLHDVWVFQLSAGCGDHKLRDFRTLWSEKHIQDLSPAVKQLFKLRNILGDLLGWDNANQQNTASSYAGRLTKNELDHSLVQPGTPLIGSFHALYEFENEALDEIVNATVHAFSLMAMERTAEGYRIYWAIYIKNTSQLTPVYMKVIDPFRKLFVYPAIINKLEQTWKIKYCSIANPRV